MDRRPLHCTRSPGRGFFLALAILALLFLGSCGPALQVWVDSDPPGAAIRIEGRSTGRRTPAWIVEKFPPREEADGFASYAIELEREGKTARGRILCWDGGFPFPVFIRRTESRDGSAWSEPFNDEKIRVRFPEPGSFLLVLHWWQKSDDSFAIDGEERHCSWSYPRDVFVLPAGTHGIRAPQWDLRVDAPEGYCIQVFEWGSANENVFLCFEPGQHSEVSMRTGETTRKLSGPDSVFPDKGIASFDFRGTDGRNCRLDLTLKGWYAHLHVRVTRD